MEKVKDVVRDVLTRYLDEKGLRKAPERYAILEEIYSHTGHFNVDSLYVFMGNKNYRVSKATLYNTLELLLECGLIVKHVFKNNTAQYERGYNVLPHEHLICEHCNKVEEFSDSRLDEVIRHVEEKYGFRVERHLLYVYGLCKSCKLKMNK